MNKTAEEACQLFEELAKNNYQAPFERALGRKPLGVLEVDQLSAFQAQFVALANQLSQQAQKGPTMGQMAFMQSSYG